MTKSFPLTITTSYVPSWGPREVVREVVQNALDAKDDGHQMSIEHRGDTLFIRSDGVKLGLNVWMMGTTSKHGTNNRGHFGEGLKLAALVAMRNRMSFKIVNDDESWTISLGEHNVIQDTEALWVKTHKLSKRRENGFVVEISPIHKDEWKRWRDDYLDLADVPEELVKRVPHEGDVIFDTRMKGKMFVKGIFVQYDPEAEYGYNFLSCDTDRDRKMVDTYDADRCKARMWSNLLLSGQIQSMLQGMLEKNAKDIQGFDTWNVSSPALQKIAQDFTQQHGENAHPCLSTAEAMEVEHYGMKGVVVQSTHHKLIVNQFPSLDKIRKDMGQQCVRVYSPGDFTDTQKAIYDKVMVLAEKAAAKHKLRPVGERLQIVDFRSQKLLGLAKGGDSIKVAASQLASISAFVGTLMHEVAHDVGADGEKQHEHMENVLLSDIIEMLLA